MGNISFVCLDDGYVLDSHLRRRLCIRPFFFFFRCLDFLILFAIEMHDRFFQGSG